MAEPAGGPDEQDGAVDGPRAVDLDWRAGAVAAATLVALVLAAGVVRAAPRTFTWLVIGGLLALALDPLVDAVQHRSRSRRAVAVAVVAAGMLLAAAGLVLLLGPPAAEQARNLSRDLPDVVDNLTDLPIIGDDLERNDVPAQVQEWIEELPARLSGDTTPIENVAQSIIDGMVAGVTTVLITLAFLLDGERLVRGGRRLVPAARRRQADEFGRLFYRIVGRYFAGSLLVAVLSGLVTLVAGLALGVPLAPLLAVNVAVFNLVPQIGGAVGGIPYVALAFTEGATTGVIAAALFLAYQQFENHVLTPVIVGEAVDLSPPATMVAALVGVSVAGVPGALVAVPFMGAAKAFYGELRPLPAGAGPVPPEPGGEGSAPVGAESAPAGEESVPVGEESD